MRCDFGIWAGRDGFEAVCACSVIEANVLVEDHGVGSLDAIVADVEFVVGDVVQDERSHGCDEQAQLQRDCPR